MSALRTPDPDPAQPTLRQRGADLKAGIARVLRPREPEPAAPVQPTATTPEPINWSSPPPGFMACPSDAPDGFVIVREGLRLELERLHRIALAEYARKVGPDATAATRARVRRELRLDVFEAANPNGDAEILALGVELDALHDRWRAATPAYFAAQAHVRRAFEEAKLHGGPTRADCQAAWSAPGVSEANDLFEDIGGELDTISRAIWRTPAYTPLGLAVKARATLVMIFTGGEYGRDSGLGEDEDLNEQAARALIEACCALAGVDWTGRPIGSDAVVPKAEEAPRPRLHPDYAWALAQAAAIDLSSLTVRQLANAYERFDEAADRWSSIEGEPWTETDPDSSLPNPNAAGRLISREEGRAARIRDRLAEEIGRREQVSDHERDRQLEMLIRHELLCNGSLQHAPELRTRITATWGR